MPWWTVDVQMRRYVDGSCDVRQSLAPPAHARNVEFMLDLTEMSPRSLLLRTMCVGPTLSSSSLLPHSLFLPYFTRVGWVIREASQWQHPSRPPLPWWVCSCKIIAIVGCFLYFWMNCVGVSLRTIGWRTDAFLPHILKLILFFFYKIIFWSPCETIVSNPQKHVACLFIVACNFLWFLITSFYQLIKLDTIAYVDTRQWCETSEKMVLFKRSILICG